MYAAENTRFLGIFPKIGIRPIIDGRRLGVGESLEAQTMNMAKRTADFISSNLRYPNGESVQCIIADTCIGGLAESAICSDKFRRVGVGATISVSPCWCYGSETMDMDPLMPKAVWGFNGTERTSPTWSTHWFVPRLTGTGPFRDVYSVMANWGQTMRLYASDTSVRN